MSDIDEWENAGPFYYRKMPETKLTEIFGSAQQMIKITPEKGRFWLQKSCYTGEEVYDTLESAKKAGNDIITKLEERQKEILLEEAGLAPSEWNISFKDGFSFEHKELNRQIIAETEHWPMSWTAMENDSECGKGCKTIIEALSCFS